MFEAIMDSRNIENVHVLFTRNKRIADVDGIQTDGLSDYLNLSYQQFRHMIFKCMYQHSVVQ